MGRDHGDAVTGEVRSNFQGRIFTRKSCSIRVVPHDILSAQVSCRFDGLRRGLTCRRRGIALNRDEKKLRIGRSRANGDSTTGIILSCLGFLLVLLRGTRRDTCPGDCLPRRAIGSRFRGATLPPRIDQDSRGFHGNLLAGNTVQTVPRERPGIYFISCGSFPVGTGGL